MISASLISHPLTGNFVSVDSLNFEFEACTSSKFQAAIDWCNFRSTANFCFFPRNWLPFLCLAEGRALPAGYRIPTRIIANTIPGALSHELEGVRCVRIAFRWHHPSLSIHTTISVVISRLASKIKDFDLIDIWRQLFIDWSKPTIIGICARTGAVRCRTVTVRFGKVIRGNRLWKTPPS